MSNREVILFQLLSMGKEGEAKVGGIKVRKNFPPSARVAFG
jgi:hypothetical protein